MVMDINIRRMNMNKNDIYDQITEKIKHKLIEGVLPWRQSWRTGNPLNFLSKKPYHGINFLSLSMCDFPSPYYLSFLQCKEKKGYIKPGEKGLLVIYWDIKELAKETDSKIEINKVPLIRYTYVYNLSQTTLYNTNEDYDPEIISADEILNNMPEKPVIKHNINRCYYDMLEDYISLPVRTEFLSNGHYLSALFHELVHWTGNIKRLNRFTDRTGKEGEALEELVAELGAAYLSGLTGVFPGILDDQVSYIASWLKALQDDRLFLIKAATQAQKAVRYILGENNLNLNNSELS
jgi:antirestriction protein ArdC